MYLTQQDLFELTDKVMASAQIRWLERNAWVYSVSALGRPKVLKAYADQRGGLDAARPKEQTEPDFSHWGGKAA